MDTSWHWDQGVFPHCDLHSVGGTPWRLSPRVESPTLQVGGFPEWHTTTRGLVIGTSPSLDAGSALALGPRGNPIQRRRSHTPGGHRPPQVRSSGSTCCSTQTQGALALRPRGNPTNCVRADHVSGTEPHHRHVIGTENAPGPWNRSRRLATSHRSMARPREAGRHHGVWPFARPGPLRLVRVGSPSRTDASETWPYGRPRPGGPRAVRPKNWPQGAAKGPCKAKTCVRWRKIRPTGSSRRRARSSWETSSKTMAD